MNIKAVIFDADGVLVIAPTLFSERFSKEYNVPYDELLQFFEGDFQLCLLGKSDLKNELAKRINKWGWDKSTDELLQYWFTTEHYLDDRIIAVIKGLQKKGIDCYLATNQEKYRGAYLLNEMGLGQLFTKAFISASVGYKKPQPEFFKHILSELKRDAREVLYWDDSKSAIETAKNLAIKAELYTNFDAFKNKMAGEYQLL